MALGRQRRIGLEIAKRCVFAVLDREPSLVGVDNPNNMPLGMLTE